MKLLDSHLHLNSRTGIQLKPEHRDSLQDCGLLKDGIRRERLIQTFAATFYLCVN